MPTSSTSSSRSWIRLRQDLFEQVQSHVEALLGERSAGLSRYQREYEKELRKAWKVSSKEALVEAIQKAQVIWMGDFHALQQSQKAQLRVLKALPNPKNVILGLECIEASQQKSLERFLQGKLSERDFLKAVEWKKNWGFPWEYYRPLFRWAQKNKVPVFGLNLKTKDRNAKALKERDQFAGQKILEIARQHPGHQIFVSFGDLHIAERHLPAVVKKSWPDCQFLSIYQNSERIYFQLLKKEIEHQVDVVKLSSHQFCLMSVPPWVKWQNYLLYLEEHYDQSFDDELDLTDHVANYMKFIGEDLGIPVRVDHFTLASANDRQGWVQLQSGLSDKNLELIENWIESGRSFFVPESGVAYLGRNTVNSAAQLAMAIVFAGYSQQKKTPLRLPQDFLRLIWLEAIQYFGSKLINPKRKTDTLADIKASLSARNPSDQGKEAMRLALSQKMLELLHLSGAKKEREALRPKKKKAYPEAARILGGILGEKLYLAYRKKLLSKSSLLTLLKKPLDSEEFSNIYWEIIEVIESFPEPFQSKTEKM
ncbi:MAG: ChaN family lipoprotein [Pseudobdellovibrionaceae bacterium]